MIGSFGSESSLQGCDWLLSSLVFEQLTLGVPCSEPLEVHNHTALELGDISSVGAKKKSIFSAGLWVTQPT